MQTLKFILLGAALAIAGNVAMAFLASIVFALFAGLGGNAAVPQRKDSRSLFTYLMMIIVTGLAFWLSWRIVM
jgi:hypothetical protein